MDDREKDPAVVLPYLVGRSLAATEVYEAFGYRKSAYYKAAYSPGWSSMMPSHIWAASMATFSLMNACWVPV